MASKESLLLPTEYKGTEIAWPFTRIGSFIERTVRKEGYAILERSISRPVEGIFKLNRIYMSEGVTIQYDRSLMLPRKSGLSVPPEYGDFNAEDVTWEGDRALVPTRVLLGRLSSDDFGSHSVSRITGDYSETVTISEKKRSMQISGKLKTQQAVEAFRRDAKLTKKARDNLANYKGDQPEYAFHDRVTRFDAKRFHAIFLAMVRTPAQ